MAEAPFPADAAQIDRVIERSTKVLLFVDIVESVRLIERDEEGVVRRWIGFVERIKADLLPTFAGRLVKSLGDGMLLEFDSVRCAAAAAFAIQDEAVRRQQRVPADQQIWLRMGIEVGDVLVDRTDIYGSSVNLAARLAGLAAPGEIVASAGARDQLTPELDAQIEDMGDCFLKHLSRPIRAFRLTPPGREPKPAGTRSAVDLAPYVAVVPFQPRRVEGEARVIGDLLAEEIIQALSRSAELNVISHLSTARFRGRKASAPVIGRHLNADYVVSGSYRTDGEKIRLDLEVADGDTGAVVYAERHKAPLDDILNGEQSLASTAAAEICGAVIARELHRARLQPLPTLKSYTLLMGAIALMHRLELREFEEAHRYLQALVERWPRLPVPQAWLAKWHVLRVQQGWSDDQRRDSYLALECTRRALDADPDCSLALAIDGLVHTNLLKRLDIARARYDLALEKNPNDALAWLLRGTLHAFMGEGAPAVHDTRHALTLTPLDPHRYFYDSLASTACLAAHRYEDALALAQRSYRANRTHTSTLRVMAASLWHLGRQDEARAVARELMSLEPNLTVSGWLARSPSAAYATGREWSEVLRHVGVPD